MEMIYTIDDIATGNIIMKKHIKRIGYFMLACSCLTGIIIILYSDFVYTIKFKYPLTFGTL